MKFIDKLVKKKYDKTQLKLWAKDMLSGLKHDLKYYQRQCQKKITVGNYADYTEAFFVKKFIKWFIENHFE